MSRYSLRNQHKIKASLGDDFLKLLIDSLDSFFQGVDDIEPYETVDLFKDEKKGLTYIFIPNVQPGTNSEFQFVLTRKMYDVYNLAYLQQRDIH